MDIPIDVVSFFLLVLVIIGGGIAFMRPSMDEYNKPPETPIFTFTARRK